MPKLTLEESRAIGGAAAEIEAQKKAKKEKRIAETTGRSASKVKFKREELPEGTRIANRKPASDGPKTKLKDVELESKRPSTQGLRSPKRGELNRGKTSVKVRKKKVKEARTGIESPYGGAPTVRRNPVTGQAESRRPPAQTTRVDLGKVTPESMTQVDTRTRVPLEVPRGGLREKTFTTKKGTSRKLRGFGIPAEDMSKLAWKAMGHLEGLMAHQPGTKEYGQHKDDFHATAEQVRPHSKDVHTMLLAAHHVAIQPKSATQQKHFNMAKDALSERISIGRAMERRRKQSQKESS